MARIVAAACLSAFLATGAADAAAPPPLEMRADGFFDPHGNRVDLRGANFGNWLLIETWMIAPLGDQFPDQYSFFLNWEERFGRQTRDDLVEAYRANFVTERDFDLFQSFGFNTIRLPIHHSVIESDDAPMQVRPGGWKWTDFAVEQASKRGMYVILDLHGAAGGQSDDHIVGRRDSNELWDSGENRARTAWLWKELAGRYKDNPAVAMYDLLNEPWGTSHEGLRELVVELHDAVREVDPETPIVFPGHRDGIDFYGSPAAHGWRNVLFTMHFYPGLFGNGTPVETTHARFIMQDLPGWRAKMQGLGTPLLVGEFQVAFKAAGGGEMMRRYFDTYNGWGWPATMWSYKLLTREGGIGSGNWYMVANAAPAPQIDFRTATLDETRAWIEGLSKIEWIPDEDLRTWMTTEREPGPLRDPGPAPPRRLVAPENDPLVDWVAVDVGFARAGGQRVDGGSMVVYGGGSDIYGEKDQFRYIARRATGDFAMTARVDDVEFVDSFTKAGLMVRTDFDTDSPHRTLCALPLGGVEATSRAAKGDPTAAKGAAPEGRFPIHLRIARTGDCVTMATSRDGMQWTASACEPCPNGGGPVLAGLVLSSHNNGQLARASFSEIAFEGEWTLPSEEEVLATMPRAPHDDALPEGWSTFDIGGAMRGGQRLVSPSGIDVYGAGDDIWEKADQFRFVAQRVRGPHAITARLSTLEDVHGYTKGGLMVRADESPDSPMAMVHLFPNGTVTLAWRPERGANVQQSTLGRAKFPDAFLRLEVDGGAVRASFGTDGKTFGEEEAVAIAGMGEERLLGLAVLSHDSSRHARGEFRQIAVEAVAER